jgi:thiopurine S-methyltransferase
MSEEQTKLEFTKSDNEYWKSEWEKRSLGFHKDERHPMLIKHHQILFGNKQKCKVFFPLCGKAVDMAWFASMGHQVVGVDLVQTAFEEFFNENKIEYLVKDIDDYKVYESKDASIRLYLGDFFKFSSKYEGLFDAVWDRGSLVAIQPSDRERYAELMLSLLALDCNYLLDTFDYDPTEWPGPPHYISEELVFKLYGKS